MNVREILDIPVLEGCRVIAGKAGELREVSQVNMMDAPDIIHFLKRDVFLITTAYHLKDEPDQLMNLIKAMDKKGCAALGVKTKRYLHEIPQQVKILADQLAFPLIEIPMNLSLGDIVNHTLSRILDNRTYELENAINVHKKFTHHIMSGKGIEPLLNNLSEMIGFPVLLLDRYSKIVSSSHREQVLIEGGSSQLPISYLADSDNAPMSITFSLIRNKRTYSIFPIYTYEKKRGYLVVAGEIEPNNHSAKLTIEQATNVISFEWMKEFALKQNYERIKNDFFFHFVEGSNFSQEEIVNRAAEFSLQHDQNYICAAGKLDSMDYYGTYTQVQLKTDSIFEYIEEKLDRLAINAHLFKKGDTCVLLFAALDPAKGDHPRILKELERIQVEINEHFDQSISFGVSNIATNFLYVKNGYKEAIDTLKASRLAGKKRFIEEYRTKDILELLRAIPEQDLKNFYEHALNKLSSPEFDDDETLLNTLFVYLETHCQISETAKRLFVHRNTVVYRLEKCQELLGRDINDSATTLQIRLAMQIKTMLQI